MCGIISRKCKSRFRMYKDALWEHKLSQGALNFVLWFIYFLDCGTSVIRMERAVSPSLLQTSQLCTQLLIGGVIHRCINDDRHLLLEALLNGLAKFVR